MQSQISAKNNQKQQRFKRLLRHVRPHHRKIRVATYYSIINKLLDLAPPLLIGLAVDVVVTREASYLSNWVSEPLSQLYLLGGLTLLIWGGESIFEYLYERSWRSLAQLIQRELRAEVYSHLHTLDAQWFAEQETGDLLATLNDDINQLERFLNVGANRLIQVITTTLAVSAVFFYTAPWVALWSLTPIPIILWGSFRFQNRIAPRYSAVRAKAAAMSAQLTHTLRGIEVVKSFTAEAREVARLDQLSAEYVEANESAIKLSAAFTPLIRMAIVIGFLSTLIYGGHLTLTEELAVGVYSVLVFLTQRLLWPLTGLGETIDLYQRALASVARAFALLDVQSTSHTGNVTIEDHQLKGEIELRGVSFAYADQAPLFEKLSIRLAPGEMTAIVGATGSGKSSLARLILGFDRPQQGEVWIDGQPLSTLDLNTWRGQVGLVSQHVYLFNGTLIENIRYGKPEASDEEIYAVVERAGLTELIERLPQQYQTRVGEGGFKLSGGERQRVSIARTLLKDPKILILDEATSAVDPYTEATIQRALAEICVDKTLLVIAHRLNTIMNAQQILVLHEGKIAEKGTHHQLLELSGIYAQLWNI